VSEKPVKLVLDHQGLEWRDLHQLVAHRLWIVAGQRGTTATPFAILSKADKSNKCKKLCDSLDSRSLPLSGRLRR
jgi:hypothetical protein